MPIPDLEKYNKRKAKGLAWVRNTGDGKLFAIVTKKFDPEDGVPIDSEVSSVYLKEVNDAIAAKQTELDLVKAFKVDILAAPPM